MGSLLNKGLIALITFSLGVVSSPYILKPSTSSKISSTVERVNTELTDLVSNNPSLTVN